MSDKIQSLKKRIEEATAQNNHELARKLKKELEELIILEKAEGFKGQGASGNKPKGDD